MARFICGRLKKKSGIWRVDGIGTIRPSALLGSRVTYLFSEIKPEFIDKPDQVHAPTGNVYQISGHAGWLRLFRPGTLWQEGQKTISPPTMELAITIDTRSCIYTFPNKVNPAFAPFDTLLSDSHLTYGDNLEQLNQTLYALVPVPRINKTSIKWLVIPTAELFRYYVGASSRLLAHALTGTTSRLVKHAQLKNGEAIIEDKTGSLTKLEASLFARSLVSHEARETLYGPHKHLVLNQLASSNAPQPLYINCCFPFKDVTTLHLAGKKIPLRNVRTRKNEWAILVNQIRNCTHPFGFSGLIIDCNGAPRRAPGDSGVSGGLPPRPPKSDIEDPAEVNDAPADPALGRLIVRNHISSFEQINHINFHRRYRERDDTNGRPYRSDTELTGNTLEDGKGGANGSGNQGIDDVDVPAKPVARDILQFLEMLKHLRTQSEKLGWKITTLGYKNNEHINGEIVTSFPMMERRLSWYKIFLDEDDAEGRPRKVVWAQIKIPHKYIYLIEMELRADERGRSFLAIASKSIDENSVEFSQQDFVDLLKLTASHNGWPPSSNDWRLRYVKIAKRLFDTFFFERLTHAHAVAKKIISNDSQTPPQDSHVEQPDHHQVAVKPEEWAKDTLQKIVDIFG